MKKFLAILLLGVVFTCNIDAQIVRSESRRIQRIDEPKKERVYVDYGQNFYVKVGGGILFREEDTFFKYNLALGYQRQFLPEGIYWGAQLGLTPTCFDFNDHKDYSEIKAAATVYLGPTIGLRRPLGGNTCFDTHIGVAYGRQFGYSEDDYLWIEEPNRLVYELGVGIWYKRVLVEVEYQGSYGRVYTDHAPLLNIGFKF